MLYPADYFQFSPESDPTAIMTIIKNNYCVEIANIVADSVNYLCRSCKGISITSRLFHNQS